MIGDRLEQYSFDYLIDRALSSVPDTVDKRQGSIIYDALAPACLELANFYMELKNVYTDTFVESSSAEALELRVAEQGITRYQATYAQKRADFLNSAGNPMSVPLGSRFATISDTNPVNYTVIGPFKDNNIVVPGAYILRAEVTGVIGNEYNGQITNITHIQGLSSATMSTLLIPARDEEGDEELRQRYLSAVADKPFGGNISQYDTELKNISGVGEVQIYPVWNGGGSVKLSVIDSEYNKLTPEFIATIQNLIDPSPQGTGLGLAPIGHTVTVVTPEEVTIDISVTIMLNPDYALGQVTNLIESSISNYLVSLRQVWGLSDELNNYSLSVYISRINAAILSVPGIANVTNTTINNQAADLVLTQTGQTQQIPILGEVTING